MNFTKKTLLEHFVKYIAIFSITAFVWSDIEEGLNNVSQAGTLDAVALLMSILALASISGYFAFSYTTVGKNHQRYFGYVATFLLGLAITLSLVVIYFIAVIWIPEMTLIWVLIIGSMFAGIVMVDNLDLLRMGLDVAATDFFEKQQYGAGAVKRHVTDFLREGHRLPVANAFLGSAIKELGKEKKDWQLTQGGQWIIDHSESTQKNIDEKVVELFSSYRKESSSVDKSLNMLSKGQEQHIADRLIGDILEDLS